jgi:tRNA (mo5U34)-methyltransferase
MMVAGSDSAKPMPDKEWLATEIKRLGPWHLLIDVRDGVDTNTGDQMGPNGRKISLVDGGPRFRSLMSRIYPEGLDGRTFFDHACNCGGYSFWAKDFGASQTFGYDVRDIWIKQAEFLRQYRQADTSGMSFRKADLYDIPKLGLPKFDITWFSGIFYHLPDPITGLKIAAEHTNELLYLNTAIKTLTDEEPGEGRLFIEHEGTEHLMTGVHSLNWYPSGPRVLQNILKWLGFAETKIVQWKKRVVNPARPEHLRSTLGRVGIIAARNKGLISHLADVKPTEISDHAWVPTQLAKHVPAPAGAE